MWICATTQEVNEGNVIALRSGAPLPARRPNMARGTRFRSTGRHRPIWNLHLILDNYATHKTPQIHQWPVKYGHVLGGGGLALRLCRNVAVTTSGALDRIAGQECA